MSIRENLKKAYIEKAFELRKLQSEIKWNYTKRLTHEEIMECDREVSLRILKEYEESAEPKG